MDRTAIFVAPLQSERTYARTAATLRSLGARFEPVFEEMVVSTRPERHDEWTVDAEVAHLERVRQRRGLAAVDLVGYSGGAAACLAYAAAHPELIRSLTLVEPPWIGNDVWSDEEARWRAAYQALAAVPDDAVWDEVWALLNTEAARKVPPLLVGRPLRDGFLLVWRGYSAAPLDRARLARIDAPVYLPVGGASAPRMRLQAERLAADFPRAEVEVLDGLGHFDIMIGGADRIAAGIARSWRP
jgi:pimeloyl-ACP methyl ester carboxylesterase